MVLVWGGLVRMGMVRVRVGWSVVVVGKARYLMREDGGE
jgi:hypothetical protein